MAVVLPTAGDDVALRHDVLWKAGFPLHSMIVQFLHTDAGDDWRSAEDVRAGALRGMPNQPADAVVRGASTGVHVLLCDLHFHRYVNCQGGVLDPDRPFAVRTRRADRPTPVCVCCLRDPMHPRAVHLEHCPWRLERVW